MTLFKTLKEALAYCREDLPPDRASKVETVLEVSTVDGEVAFVLSTNYRRRLSLLNQMKPEGIRVFLSVAYDFKEEYRMDKLKRVEKYLPGLTILRSAQAEAEAEALRYIKVFRQRLEDQDGDREPLRLFDESYQQTFSKLSNKYPRARLYLAAESLARDSYWQHDGSIRDPLQAMSLLMDGGAMKEAEVLMVGRDGDA